MNKYEQYKRLIMFSLDSLLMAALALAYSYVWHKEYLYMVVYPFRGRGNLLLIAIYVSLLIIFLAVYGGYKFGIYTAGNIIFSQMLSIVMVNIITYFQISLIGRALLTIRPMIFLTLVEIIIVVIWVNIAIYIYRAMYPPHSMLMIYGSDMVDFLVQKLKRRKDKYEIKEKINVQEGLEVVFDRINKYNAVLICDVKTETRNKILKYCFEHSVRTYVTPKISDIIIRGASEIKLFDTPLILCKNLGLTFEQKVAKRIMDILGSVLVLLVTSPIMLLTAIAIKLSDGGPVFFKQLRCTVNQKEFEILKFRSMIVNAEEAGEVIPATTRDPRITPIGRIIRAARIDELPQLINVLKGEMSIVGPRPERVEHIEQYTEEIPEFLYRLKVKGGLTGYAQIIGKYNTTAYDKLKLDLIYIENYSILLDLRLLLMTIKVIFMRESTEGFEVLEREDKNE